jgi:hypothetical protein
MATTTPAAMAQLERVRARVEARQAVEHPDAPADPPAAEEGSEALARLRDELGKFDGRLAGLIVGAYKNGGQGADYGLLIDGLGDVSLGTAKQLLSPAHVEATLLDAIGIAPNLPSKNRWREVAELIHAAAEIRDVSITDDEVTREWVAEFVEYAPHMQGVNLTDPEQLEDLVRDDPATFTDTSGCLYVRLRHFHQHLTRKGERITRNQLAQRLGALGFTRAQLSGRPPGGGEPLKLRVWQSRPGFDPNP